MENLIDLGVKHRKNKTSEYGERVAVCKNYFHSMLKEMDDGKWYGAFSFSYTVTGKTTGRILTKYECTKSVFAVKGNITEGFVESLIVWAFSGIYATPQDYDRLSAEMAQLGWHSREQYPWGCEGCGAVFKNPDELIEHLSRTGHYDSCFEFYPHYQPLIDISRTREVRTF